MKHIAICVSLVVLLPTLASACIWDSDTLQDELQSRSSAFDVITGQFPQHGRAYYAKRLERSTELLQRASESIEVMYDVSASHMRLGDYTKGIELLDKVNGIAPGRYKTFSNLGVAYYLKAANGGDNGDYESAHAFTKKALEKQQDAHFGAGWLFLKMIDWKSTLWETGVPGTFFVGGAYGNRWKSSIRGELKKRAQAQRSPSDSEAKAKIDPIKPLLTLLRAHPEFADGYFVLGMNLHNEWNLNLALWAYVRALELGHSNPKAIHKQIDEVYAHWTDLLKHRQQRSNQTLMSKDDTLQAIRKQLKVSSAWLTSFQDAEAKLIAKTGDLPDFEAVTKALAAQGIKRHAATAVGLIGGTRGGSSPAEGGPANSANDAHDERQSRPVPKSDSDAQDAPGKLAPPVGGLERKAKQSKDDQPPLMLGGAAPAPGSDAATGAPASQGDGPALPWYVLFGLGMLAVSVVAVLIGRARTA